MNLTELMTSLTCFSAKNVHILCERSPCAPSEPVTLAPTMATSPTTQPTTTLPTAPTTPATTTTTQAPSMVPITFFPFYNSSVAWDNIKTTSRQLVLALHENQTLYN